MLDHVFTDAIGALREALENALLERQAFEERFQTDILLGRDGDREEVLHKYRRWLLARPQLIDRARRELRGKTLGCFCKPLLCHGDVLAEIADSDV